MADPAVRIVTLTVTEKGYCHEPATGALNPAHPDIVHDLAHPTRRARRPASSSARCAAAGGGAPRRSPCSAATTCPRTAAWCAAWCSSSPRRDRPGARRLDRRRGRLPLHDGRPHRAGDQARGHRPARRAAPACSTSRRSCTSRSGSGWSRTASSTAPGPTSAPAGVELVADVTPFEHDEAAHAERHPFGARLSRLSRRPRDDRRHRRRPGLRRASSATSGRRRSSRRSRRRRASTSPPMPRRCFARYANPAIRHRTWQIAMDGSQKLPQRILGTLADNRAAGRPAPGLDARGRRLDALRRRDGRSGARRSTCATRSPTGCGR